MTCTPSAENAPVIQPGLDSKLSNRSEGFESDRREAVVPSVTGRQLGCLPNMIQPPLLGVVNAASAVPARTLTCRAPAVPRSCSMLRCTWPYGCVRSPDCRRSSRTSAVPRP